MRLQLLKNPLKEPSHEAGSFGEKNGDEHLEVFKTVIAPYFFILGSSEVLQKRLPLYMSMGRPSCGYF